MAIWAIAPSWGYAGIPGSGCTALATRYCYRVDDAGALLEGIGAAALAGSAHPSAGGRGDAGRFSAIRSGDRVADPSDVLVGGRADTGRIVGVPCSADIPAGTVFTGLYRHRIVLDRLVSVRGHTRMIVARLIVALRVDGTVVVVRHWASNSVAIGRGVALA